MTDFRIVDIELILLFLNLISILFTTIYRKRTASIILIVVAMFQLFLLHWNRIILIILMIG